MKWLGLALYWGALITSFVLEIKDMEIPSWIIINMVVGAFIYLDNKNNKKGW